MKRMHAGVTGLMTALVACASLHCEQAAAATPNYKSMSDADIAKAFRPRFRFKKSTRCFGLTFTESSPTTNYCRKEYDDKFVVLAHVTRPGASENVAYPDGNTFRVSYGVAFGYQEGSFTGLTQSTLAMFTDAGNHGEDAQYLVVDVVDGKVTSVWADLHTGYYALARGGLSMAGDNHVVAWVGAYYHPFKLVDGTSSVCRSAAEGALGYSANVSNDGLRTLCVDRCPFSRTCPGVDTILNWGDPSGSDHEGDGVLAVVNEVCGASESYASPDGPTFTKAGPNRLLALQGYACGSLPAGAAGNWESNFKSKPAYRNAYGLKGCKAGDSGAGSICNVSHFVEGQPWATSIGRANITMDPRVAGNVTPDFATGSPFSDLTSISGPPASITLRSGERVDAVSTSWGAASRAHGGDGGAATTLSGLAQDPVVRVELCEATKDKKVRLGRITLTTRSGRVKKGGAGSDACQTIAPPGKVLYGFFGRAGGEIDVLGTYWGEPQ